ncbi:hypothetical protein MY3296_009820 [Beauveria thailandica]
MSDVIRWAQDVSDETRCLAKSGCVSVRPGISCTKAQQFISQIISTPRASLFNKASIYTLLL